jgi:nicotinamidase-related amidase
MTVLDTLNLVAFNPLQNNNPIAILRHKLIAKIDEQIKLAVNRDYTPTQHKLVTDEDSWGGNRYNKDAEVRAKIIARWRSHNEKIIHARHSSIDINSKLHASNNGFRFNPLCKPIKDETVLTKSVNSCFIGTNLRGTLDQMNCNTVVIVGLTTDHCVSTTTRMAGNFGYDIYLISDSTATFDKLGQNGEIFD